MENHNSGLATDYYQLLMMQQYFFSGMADSVAVFDYFFRALPFEGGYAIFAGLDTLLDSLESLKFNAEDLAYLKNLGFKHEFLQALKELRFTGELFAMQEGEVIYPNTPIVRVKARLIEAQWIETLLLNTLNFQTLIATKASRIRQLVPDKILMDFGYRRAQGEAAYVASRAIGIGGFDGTSNVVAGRDFGIPVMGTMAHAMIQSFETELAAFRSYAKFYPDSCILLVDTYNTLESGVPNAITVAHELKAKGHELKGIRLDSGDLAYLSKKARKMLDEAGLTKVSISVSNQLDEYVIKSLLDQKAPIDAFGVGTRLIIGYPDAALDGVYKLSMLNDKPRIKLSENTNKMTLPAEKQVYRVLQDSGEFFGADVISLLEESAIAMMVHPLDKTKKLALQDYTLEPLLFKVMTAGKRLFAKKSIQELSFYRQKRLNKLPEEYQRFGNPHHYKVGLSKKLKLERDTLIRAWHKTMRNL